MAEFEINFKIWIFDSYGVFVSEKQTLDEFFNPILGDFIILKVLKNEIIIGVEEGDSLNFTYFWLCLYQGFLLDPEISAFYTPQRI